MSPHVEILEAAATFGDDSVGLLSYICSIIPQIVRSRSCPCLWCTGVEDNPLIAFDDLQDRMVDSWSTSVSACASKGHEVSRSIPIDPLPPRPVWNSVLPLTSAEIEAIQRQRWIQRLNMQTNQGSVIGVDTNTSYQPTQPIPTPTQPRSTIIQHQRNKESEIDQQALLAAEIRSRAQKRARDEMGPGKPRSRSES